MKTILKIPKNRLYAPIDFGEVIDRREACGVKFSYTEYGFMQFESGKIVIFDAYSAANKYVPFDVECAHGAFPFFCGCMTDNGERVAYAGLRFGEERATEWKPLLLDLKRIATEPDAGGVNIVSGVCCIADKSAYEEYCAHIKDEVHPLAGLIVLDGQTHTTIDLFGMRYAVFSTGWGDGRYNCYAGLANGKVTAIIADFGMIKYPTPDSELAEVEIDVERSGDLYVYDPSKTVTENNIARWTAALECAVDDMAKLRAYSRRGYAYHSANDKDRALADYTSAMECCKNISDRHELTRAWSVYDNAADIYISRGDYDSAIAVMQMAMDVRDAFYAGAYVRLIDLYQLVKREDKSLEIAQKMRELRPDDAVAHMKYAECCVSVMDYKSAAAVYDELATEFRLYENLFDEAACLIELGEYEKADATLERHPAKDIYEQYWYYKAYIMYKAKRLNEALYFAQKSHDIDREYMPALYLLIDIQSLLNEYHAVAMYAEEYKKLRPDNEYGYSICADAQLILGNITESARNYCRLCDGIKPDDKYAALAAALCARIGDNKRSDMYLKKLRRKKSEYYHCALYFTSVAKNKGTDVDLNGIIGQLNADPDYSVMLSVFLLHTNNLIPATQLLKGLIASGDPAYDVVAQQIRVAEKIGDDKLFLSFFTYYADKFLDGNLPPEGRRNVAESFIANPQKHGAWLQKIQ